MKRIITVCILSVIFLILDNSLVPFIAVKGYYPSLLFTFAISYALVQGQSSALKIGAFSGILQDIYFQGAFGVNGFINMVTCLVAAEIGKIIFKEKKLIPILTILVASILKGILMCIFLYILKFYMNPYKIIFISLYNMVIGIFMYSYVYKLSIKNFMRKDWKF